MSGPNLTVGEQDAISSAIAAISASQAQYEKPLQVKPDDQETILVLGVPENIVNAAGPAGFSFSVDEYVTPANVRGWVLNIVLVRDGITWAMAHHEGPESHRAFTWTQVETPVMLQ